MAIVFQEYNLFPNMSVSGNVAIAPARIKRMPAAESEADKRRLPAKVGPADMPDAYPTQLSAATSRASRSPASLCSSPRSCRSTMSPRRVSRS